MNCLQRRSISMPWAIYVRESQQSTCTPASESQDQGIRPDSTSTRGTRSSSTRRGCTRTCRRASGDLPATGGTRLGDVNTNTRDVQSAGARTLCWRLVVLQPRLDGLVLLVEERHVRHEVLDDIHYPEGSASGHGQRAGGKRTVR